MDFSAVVHKARQLLDLAAAGGSTEAELARPAGEQLELREEVYGRVCTTVGKGPPIRLSSDAERKSVFLFGPDAVKSILLQYSAYDILCSIGRDKDYLHYTVCPSTVLAQGMSSTGYEQHS